MHPPSISAGDSDRPRAFAASPSISREITSTAFASAECRTGAYRSSSTLMAIATAQSAACTISPPSRCERKTGISASAMPRARARSASYETGEEAR